MERSPPGSRYDTCETDMKITEFLTAALFLAGTVFQANASDIPRGEYPRPQFERTAWMNLNGVWDYTFDFSGSGLERGLEKATAFEGRITVPFCPESSLSGVGYTDFINCIWYHREVAVPEAWRGKDILLNFGAVYYNAEVYVDGVFAARHIGGSSSFSVDLTRLVTPGKSHHLVVRATSDVRSTTQGAGKQNLQYASYGCNYTRTTGIWQTVWMEAVDPAGLLSAHVVTDIDQGQLVITPRFRSESGNTLHIAVKEGGKVVATAAVRAANSSVAVLPVKRPKLWSPESPFLYDITYRIVNAKGEVLDEVNSYAGMRKVHIEGNRIYLNNEPYYQRLVLDQGFYPDGIWTAPSDDALRRDIELGLAAGFNGARLHQKVFEERYYYWADRLGYITWGESPSWGMDANDVETARNFLSEWAECVVRDRNHPSLLTWTPMNEEWWPDNTQFPRFASDVYDLTGRLDPTRPVNTVSGGAVVRTDIWAVHNYEQNPAKLKEKIFSDGTFFHPRLRTTRDQTRNIGFNEVKATANYAWPQYDGSCPYLVDEFGGIKWVKDQEKQATDSQTESWGYGQAPRTLEEFYTRLEGQVDALLSLSGQVWGYCYTQLTDVEQEQNGIYCYDRSAKFDMDRIKAIFSKRPEHPAR